LSAAELRNAVGGCAKFSPAPQAEVSVGQTKCGIPAFFLRELPFTMEFECDLRHADPGEKILSCTTLWGLTPPTFTRRFFSP
jgi:hypothetical protein